MLKPGNKKLTDNDYFYILIGLTAGDAHNQACALLEELEEELAATNEAAKALHDRQSATSDSTDSPPSRQKKTAGAGSSQESAGDGTPVVGEFQPETLYHDPINRFWKLMERLYPERGPARINKFRSFALKPNETMSSAIERMMTLRRLLKQPKQMAVMLFLQAIQPKRLQEEIRRQLMSLACDAENWTLQQVGEIVARLEKAHSFESLWMTAVRPKRPAPASAAPAPSCPPPHNPMRLTTPLTCHECGKPGHKRPECPRLSRTKAPAAAHRGAAGPPSGLQDTRECYICGEIGHISMRCPQRQMANATASGLHTNGPSKPTRRKWCVNHQLSSHDTAECKRPPDRAINQAPVAARSAQSESKPALDQTVAAMDPDPGAPTHEQLMNLWETTYGSRTAPDMHAFRGTVVMAPTAQSPVYATAASLRTCKPTNERV
jgi:hypothetical protein